MNLVIILMEVIKFSFYAIILLSKINIYYKIIIIAFIYYILKIDEKFNNYLQTKIKQKLPNKKLIEQKLKEGETNIYGMPSGHAQYIAFVAGLIYLFYLNTKNLYFYILFIIIIFIYIYEYIICIINNYHTHAQYIAGTFVGLLMSSLTFFILFLIIGKKNINKLM